MVFSLPLVLDLSTWSLFCDGSPTQDEMHWIYFLVGLKTGFSTNNLYHHQLHTPVGSPDPSIVTTMCGNPSLGIFSILISGSESVPSFLTAIKVSLLYTMRSCLKK